MGYYVEVNTLVRLPEDVNIAELAIGQKITITRERERIVPLHIALLFIDKEWNFYGYCRVNSSEIKDQTTKMEVEIISLFNSEERRIYKEKFVAAGKITSEIK
jgi:hypothetical protein